MAGRARLAAVVTLVALAATLPVHADDGARDPEVRDDDAESLRLGTMTWQAGVVFLIPTLWYWNTASHQAVDWTLDWNWPSWRAKLTFEKVRFDTNPIYVNAIRHPIAGVLDYHIARTSGLGMLGSTVLAFVAGVAWEYVVEYREDPSINDMIFNANGGVAIGEPLWQFGQLWRGGVQSLGDRARTAAFSPFDAFDDTFRVPHRWHRPRAWRSIEGTAGLDTRSFGGGVHDERALAIDLDLVSERNYLLPGARSGTTAPGTWSRLRWALRLADGGRSTFLHSHTSIFGHYAQDGDGNGRFLGLGTAFTYRKDMLMEEWDHLGVAHLLGPQLQLSRRTPSYEVRWDASAYADFALVTAHVFGPVPPFPRPPPFLSALQAEGYYDAAGASAFTRLRVDTGPWRLDVELDGHRWWQISGADRVVLARSTNPTIAAPPRGVADWRLFWRGAVTYRLGQWGISATADGAYRRGTWLERSRESGEVALGGALVLDL
jgi:hypothetical protein